MLIATEIKLSSARKTAIGYFEYAKLNDTFVWYQYKDPVDIEGKRIYGVEYVTNDYPSVNYEKYWIVVHTATGLIVGICKQKSDIREYLKVWNSYQWTLGAEKDTLIGTNEKNSKITIKSLKQHTIQEENK